MLKDLQLVSDIVRYANPCKFSSSVVATAASSLCCWEFLVAFAVPSKAVYKLNPYTPNAADETATSHVANTCVESIQIIQ